VGARGGKAGRETILDFFFTWKSQSQTF
jgi:hypothetical protein